MRKRHHHSGVFLPWDLESTPNTPFIAQVHHVFNLHTPLGRDIDRTGAEVTYNAFVAWTGMGKCAFIFCINAVTCVGSSIILPHGESCALKEASNDIELDLKQA